VARLAKPNHPKHLDWHAAWADMKYMGGGRDLPGRPTAADFNGAHVARLGDQNFG